MLVPNGEEEKEAMIIEEEAEVEPKDVVKRGGRQSLFQGLLPIQQQVGHCPSGCAKGSVQDQGIAISQWQSM
jgi:hypothetical protein